MDLWTDMLARIFANGKASVVMVSHIANKMLKAAMIDHPCCRHSFENKISCTDGKSVSNKRNKTFNSRRNFDRIKSLLK